MDSIWILLVLLLSAALGTQAVPLGEVNPSYQIVLEGTRVILECGSASKTNWMKDSKEVSSPSLGNDFIINIASQHHTGIYTCHGTYDSGEQFTATSELIVAAQDDSKLDKTELVLSLGQDASIACKSLTKPFWYYESLSTEPIANSVRLHIPEVQQFDEGEYFCVGQGLDFIHFVAKATIRIAKDDQFYTDSITSSYKHTEDSSDLRENHDPFVQPDSYTLDKEFDARTLYKPYSEHDNQIGTTNEWTRWNSQESEQQKQVGNYDWSAKGDNKYNHRGYQYSKGLQAHSQHDSDVDDIIVKPEYSALNVGESIEFDCTSTKETKWYHNNGELPNNVDTRKNGNVNTLMIPYVFEYNAGKYSCYGIYDKIDPEKTNIIQPNVGILDVGPQKPYWKRLQEEKYESLLKVGQPKQFEATVKPKNLRIDVGQNAHITCYSKEKVIVTFQGGELPTNVHVKQVGETEHDIKVQHAVLDNSGKYQCYGQSEFPAKPDKRSFGDNIAYLYINKPRKNWRTRSKNIVSSGARKIKRVGKSLSDNSYGRIKRGFTRTSSSSGKDDSQDRKKSTQSFHDIPEDRGTYRGDQRDQSRGRSSRHSSRGRDSRDYSRGRDRSRDSLASRDYAESAQGRRSRDTQRRSEARRFSKSRERAKSVTRSISSFGGGIKDVAKSAGKRIAKPITSITNRYYFTGFKNKEKKKKESGKLALSSKDPPNTQFYDSYYMATQSRPALSNPMQLHGGDDYFSRPSDHEQYDSRYRSDTGNQQYESTYRERRRSFQKAGGANVIHNTSKDCPRLNIDGADINYKTTNASSYAKILCKHGFVLQGVPLLQCQSDGTWNNKIPTCNKISNGLILEYHLTVILTLCYSILLM